MLDLNHNPKNIQEGTLNALIMIHNECEAAGAREAMYQLADLIDQVACRHLVVTMPAGPRVPPTESKPGGRARMLILTDAQVNALGRALDYAHDDQEHASKADYTPEDMAGLAETYRDIGSVGEMLFNGELERWGALANEVLGEDICRICGEQYKDDGGDGFDGCCPGCADKVNELAEARGISFGEAAGIYAVDNTAEVGKCVDCGEQCVSGGDGSVVCPKCDAH